MNIIVFGGNGFIGKHLSFLLEKKNKVFIYGNKDYSKKGINLIKYNKSNFIKILRKVRPDVIYFLSGNSYPNNTINDDLHDFKSTNLIIQELLSALKKTSYSKLFIYTSSIAVYGSVKSRQHVNEKFRLNPESFYGNSKYLAEKQIEYFSKISKFNSIVLRLSSVYGPGLKRQIIYQIIKNSLHSNLLRLNGSILDKRQFLFVHDCSQMLIKLIYKKHKKFEIYNIANGKKIKILNLIKFIQKILNKKISIKFLNNFKSPSLPALSNDKFKKNIGSVKYTNIENGLIKTLKWIENKKF